MTVIIGTSGNDLVMDVRDDTIANAGPGTGPRRRRSRYAGDGQHSRDRSNDLNSGAGNDTVFGGNGDDVFGNSAMIQSMAAWQRHVLGADGAAASLARAETITRWRLRQ
jgi:Ca2+-binding RTX toxin-like protein